MQQVRTKLHRLVEAVNRGQCYFTAEGEGGYAPPIADFGVGIEVDPKGSNTIKGLLKIVEAMPKFAMAPDLMEMVRDPDLNASLLDMQRAGVLRLPFPEVCVELPKDHSRLPSPGSDYNLQAAFVILSESSKQDRQFYKSKGWKATFNCFFFALYNDPTGDYAVFSPSVVGIGVFENESNEPWLRLEATAAWPQAAKALDRLIEKTYAKDAASCWQALFAMTVILGTRGLKHEVIEVDKLNKARKAAGKPLVHKHTYISISHVYKRVNGDAATEYVQGKSPRPHWRRGHIHRWRTGPMKNNDRGWGEKWIEGRIVALAEDAIVKPAEYTVKP